MSGELARAEGAARDRARTAVGGPAGGGGSISARDLQPVLGARRLVEYVVSNGTLLAAVVTSDSFRIVDLGAVAAVQAERDYLAAEVQRALRTGATKRGAGHSARFALDELIVAPLALPTSAELVIVPTGPLHSVLWSALPGLSARVFTVAPSATSWARMAIAPATEGRETLGVVLGPDLPGGAQEVDALVRSHPDAIVLQDGRATTRSTLDLLRRVRIAHVAAHGVYRSDSPLFSSFQLDDGSLTVYDMETVDQPPELFVLSSCEAGAQSVTRGDELLGMASALVASGVRAVVAPSVCIGDVETPELMRSFYQGIDNGLSVAGALTAARTSLSGSRSTGEQMAAWSFVCFGYSGTIATAEYRRPVRDSP